VGECFFDQDTVSTVSSPGGASAATARPSAVAVTGRLVTGSAKKVGVYLDEWQEGHVALTVQPTTYDTYRRDVSACGHISASSVSSNYGTNTSRRHTQNC
jgi:hypothetical protein